MSRSHTVVSLRSALRTTQINLAWDESAMAMMDRCD